MIDGGGDGQQDDRVQTARHLAELQKDSAYTREAVTALAATLKEQGAEQQRAREKQAGDLAALRDHFDDQFMALRQTLSDQARGQAVFEACARQWQVDHEQTHEQHGREHEREHGAEARKNRALELIIGAAATALGILIQPGGSS